MVDGVVLVSERLVLRPAGEADLDFYDKLGMRHCGETQHEDAHTTYELFELTESAPTV